MSSVLSSQVDYQKMKVQSKNGKEILEYKVPEEEIVKEKDFNNLKALNNKKQRIEKAIEINKINIDVEKGIINNNDFPGPFHHRPEACREPSKRRKRYCIPNQCSSPCKININRLKFLKKILFLFKNFKIYIRVIEFEV